MAMDKGVLLYDDICCAMNFLDTSAFAAVVSSSHFFCIAFL